MKHKNRWGLLFLLVSIAFFLVSFNPVISGGVISVNKTISPIFFVGLLFLIMSFILLIQREGLEYLVIPVGREKWENPRAKSARELIRNRHIDRVVITGDIDAEKRLYKGSSGQHERGVYDAIRKEDIRPGQIKLLHGKDSEEDILYLGKIVKSKDTVYFDTFPLHFQEYRTLVKKAQRDGKFPENVTLRNARIPQGRTETIYGLLGWLEEVLKRRPLDYKKNRESGLLDKVKTGVKRLIGA